MSERASESENASALNATHALGSAASDPIPIDCDDDDGGTTELSTISVKVFEAEKGVT